MHARNRTWPLGSDPAERCRQRTLPVEGGDGSTLSLDFTTGVLDPRLTFTRGTNATFINSSGLVEWAAANILVRSNELSNTGLWARTGIVAPTTSSSAPTGDAAWRLEESAGVAGTHSLAQSPAASQGVPYTFSILVKKDQRNWIVIQIAAATFVYFNANAGVFGTSSGTLIGFNKIDVGDGWWRVYISANALASSLSCVVYLASANGTVSYTGVSGQGLFIASPQIEPGIVMRSYNQTGSAAYYAPRFDYDPISIGTPRGLAIEGQTDNRVTQSESFSSWTLSSAVLGATESGPDGNTSSALTLQEDNTNNVHVCVLTSRTVTSGSSATFSVFIKAGASPRRYILIRVNDNASNANAASVMWDTQTRTISGAATAYGTFTNASATRTEYAATSWDRIALTFTPSTATIACKLELSNNGSRSADGQSVAYLGDNSSGVLIWGAQLETGSGASSYIPTGASTGTRNPDLCYMSGISSWFNAPTGTIISKVTYSSLTGTNAGIELSVGTGSSAANRIGIRKDYVDYYSGAALQAEMYPTVTSGAVQIGTAYAAGDFAMCSNGGTMRTKSSGSVPSGLDTLKLYSEGGASAGLLINGWVRSFKYFPTRLSNAQLQSLTT